MWEENVLIELQQICVDSVWFVQGPCAGICTQIPFLWNHQGGKWNHQGGKWFIRNSYKLDQKFSSNDGRKHHGPCGVWFKNLYTTRNFFYVMEENTVVRVVKDWQRNSGLPSNNLYTAWNPLRVIETSEVNTTVRDPDSATTLPGLSPTHAL